jgi:hypothetical protein
MRAWYRIGWFAVAVALPACGGPEPRPVASPWPPCGSAPGLRSFGTVPAGDAAFVVYANDCPEKMLPGDVRITDSSATVLGVELEPWDDYSAELLVRTEPPLVPGTYQVVTPDGRSQSLTVTEPAALPTTLGELTVKSQSNCEIMLDLALDEAALPYLSLMGTDVHVIPGYPKATDTLWTWVSPGELEVRDGHVARRVGMPNWNPGEHTVELRAVIAGYDTEVLPAAVTIDWSCAVE